LAEPERLKPGVSRPRLLQEVALVCHLREGMRVSLLLIAALGILAGHRLGVARRVAPASIVAAAMHAGHLAGTSDRSWIGNRLPANRWRMAGTAGLLVWGVAAGILTVQSQTVAPPDRTVPSAGSASGAEFYLTRGEESAGAHDYDRAIADYDTAIQLKPDYAEAYNDRGFAYYLKGNAERAIADFTRAIELRPNYPKAYNSRGVVYMAHGYGRARAVADFDRAIALKPDFRYAYINRANARLLKHPWLALDDFHRAGMYPERRASILGGAILVLAVGIALLRRTRIRKARGSA
jgi:Tfp pilus assembly protein PilF